MKHQLRGSLPVRLVRDSCQNGYQCPSASKLSRRLSPFLKTGLRFLGKRGPLLRNGDNLGESEEKRATGTVARPPGTPSCRRCSRRMRSRGRGAKAALVAVGNAGEALLHIRSPLVLGGTRNLRCVVHSYSPPARKRCPSGAGHHRLWLKGYHVLVPFELRRTP